MSHRPIETWGAGVVGVLAASLAMWLLLGPTPGETIRVHLAEEDHRQVDVDLEAPALDQVPFPLEGRIRRGDTLDRVLRRAGVADDELAQAAAAVAEVLDPRKLRANAPYFSLVRRNEGLVGIRFPRRGYGVTVAERSASGWKSHYRPYRRSYLRRSLRGELSGPLESSIREAGGDARLANSMAKVLQWNLDFNRDLRLGDRFELVFDELLLDGELQGVATIHGLRYRNRDRWHEAYRFSGDEADGRSFDRYYDADGRPLQRQFLRSPLPYSRVTSRFSMNRYHPVLKRRMPHYGVDYGAPTGTPVRATADGTVLSAGVRGGGGRTIRLRHANGYLTAYLHLSGYAPGVRAGALVEQGQVIGYVGSTGLSTGPHLDYRVQHNGRWINPAALTNDPAPPLAENLRPAFLRHRDALLGELVGVKVAFVSGGP